MDQEYRKFVKFHKCCSPYLAGEVGAFPIPAATKLTSGSNPIGFYVKRGKNGEWVPEKENENGYVEQTDENGSVAQDGAGETDDTNQPDDSKTENAGTRAAPKAGGQPRRQRAKL